MKQFRDTQYYITDKHQVYNVITKRYVTPYPAHNGRTANKKYLAVGLYINGKRKNFLYHRLLAEVFIPNPHGLPQVNHIDGNSFNNDLLNLEWVSCSDNNLHAIKTGLRPTKLNMKKANEIRVLLAEGYPVSQICQMYNIGKNMVSKIGNNISWKI